MHVTNKFVPKHPNPPPPPGYWNELLFPREFPLSFFEMSFLLPHFLKEGRGKLDVYFTRVYNPLWTNPDGFSWMEVLQDKRKDRPARRAHADVERDGVVRRLHPADGARHRAPRHDEPGDARRRSGSASASRCCASRARSAARRSTPPTKPNPGEVWEESEFWIALSWQIDPDGSLGIRKYFESPYRPGEQITVDEYYRWMFENSVPGLPEAAAKENLTPLEYMRKYGVFKVSDKTYSRGFEKPFDDVGARGHDPRRPRTTSSSRTGRTSASSSTASTCPASTRRRGCSSSTRRRWSTGAGRSTRCRATCRATCTGATSKRDEGEFDLLPNFRLPTLIHTRSPVKWLYEISHNNPLWISTHDARRHGIATGDLVKVTTRIGYFVTRAWVTEGIRPGVLGMSHHLGRWRLNEDTGGPRVASALVRISRESDGRYVMKQVHGAQPFESDDPDTGARLVERGRRAPEPHVPGAARPGERHALLASAGAAREGRARTMLRRHRRRHQPGARGLQGMDGEDAARAGPDGLRRPLWFDRPLRPVPDAYKLPSE